VTTEIVLSSPSEFISIALLDPWLALDTETTGKDIRSGEGYCVGISAACRSGEIIHTAYFPVGHHEDNIDPELLALLIGLIKSRDKLFMHNAKFDLISFETAGIDLSGLKWYCTMRMAHMLNENLNMNQYGLDWLARYELKIPGKDKTHDFRPIWKMGLGNMIPVEEMEEYAARDAGILYLLFERLYPMFVKSGFDGSEVSEVR
jgi:ribonuclease D